MVLPIDFIPVRVDIELVSADTVFLAGESLRAWFAKDGTPDIGWRDNMGLCPRERLTDFRFQEKLREAFTTDFHMGSSD